jgi:predicted nucleic acid-binding protein
VRILVDTSVWSMALRRHQNLENAEVSELRELVTELRVQMIGPVRQELLSGVRSMQQFAMLREHLQAFPDLPLTSEDYELAASCYNICRAKGIQGSNTDFLLCAIAQRHDLSIFTTDGDFKFFQEYLPINLHSSRMG